LCCKVSEFRRVPGHHERWGGLGFGAWDRVPSRERWEGPTRVFVCPGSSCPSRSTLARRQGGQAARRGSGRGRRFRFRLFGPGKFSVLNLYRRAQNRTGDRKWLRQIPVEVTGTFRHVPRQNHVSGVRVPLPKNRMGATPRPELMGEPASELVPENWLSLLDLGDERWFV